MPAFDRLQCKELRVHLPTVGEPPSIAILSSPSQPFWDLDISFPSSTRRHRAAKIMAYLGNDSIAPRYKFCTLDLFSVIGDS